MNRQRNAYPFVLLCREGYRQKAHITSQWDSNTITKTFGKSNQGWFHTLSYILHSTHARITSYVTAMSEHGQGKQGDGQGEWISQVFEIAFNILLALSGDHYENRYIGSLVVLFFLTRKSDKTETLGTQVGVCTWSVGTPIIFSRRYLSTPHSGTPSEMWRVTFPKLSRRGDFAFQVFSWSRSHNMFNGKKDWDSFLSTASGKIES